MLVGNHIIITTQFKNNSSSINTHTLIDCGATGYTFVDQEFAHDHDLPLYKLKKSRYLEVINGRPIESSLITHMTKLHMVIAGHINLILLFVTKLGYYPIILGLPWLHYYNINI